MTLDSYSRSTQKQATKSHPLSRFEFALGLYKYSQRGRLLINAMLFPDVERVRSGNR